MIIDFESKYIKKQKASLLWSKYRNGRPCLSIVSGGETLCVASVNLPDAIIPDGYIAIKDYSENEGVLKSLQANGIVNGVWGYIRSGFVAIPIVKILVEQA